MAFTRVAALLHAALSDVAATQHHTATVAGDLNLADLAARAHVDLSDAPADAHHAQAHTPESHTGQSLTAVETDTLRNAGDAEALHSHVTTREMSIPAVSLASAFPYAALSVDHQLVGVASSGAARFVFFVPNTFVALVGLDVIINPNTTETIQWDITSAFAAIGELDNANTDSVANAMQAVVVATIIGLDVSGEVTGMAAGDIVGITFVSNTSNIDISMLRLRYTE